MSAFHADKKSWAKIKHSILGTYLPLFISKTRLFQKHVYLVDGFAGQGRYDDGEAGSALISADIALNPITVSNRGVFRCINVEKDPVFFSKLEEATKEHSKRGFVRNLKGEFEKTLPDILQSIEGETALFFIDPFGTEGATANTLSLISDQEGVTEALIRFDDTRVKRLINFNKNDLAGENIKAVKTAERFLERARKLTSEEGVKASLFKDPNAGRIIVEEYIKLVVRDLKLVVINR
jgi:three-Cys-motif partner protein